MNYQYKIFLHIPFSFYDIISELLRILYNFIQDYTQQGLDNIFCQRIYLVINIQQLETNNTNKLTEVFCVFAFLVLTILARAKYAALVSLTSLKSYVSSSCVPLIHAFTMLGVFLYDTEGLVQCFTSSIMARENTAEATRRFYCSSYIT